MLLIVVPFYYQMYTYVTSCFTFPDLIDHFEVLWPHLTSVTVPSTLHFHEVTTLYVSSCVPYFGLYMIPPSQAIMSVLNKRVIHCGSWSGGQNCEHGLYYWFELQEKGSPKGSTWINLSETLRRCKQIKYFNHYCISD